MQMSTILLPTSLSLATGSLYQLFLQIHRLPRADINNDILEIWKASEVHLSNWTRSSEAQCNLMLGVCCCVSLIQKAVIDKWDLC